MKIIWPFLKLFPHYWYIYNHCFHFPALDVMGSSLNKHEMWHPPHQPAWRCSDVFIGALGLDVCLCSLTQAWAHKERQLEGWPAEPWAEGPLPNPVPLIHLNADLEKLPCGMWWGVNLISILTWVLSFSAPWLPCTRQHRLDWLGVGRIDKVLWGKLTSKGPVSSFRHGPLS